ncbi:MAG: CRISPR system precrRNA processing endoribonuclease RAMP protein Cas6 [Chloroflexota bacterium]|nr:CRISPR system precrRNA processing endoribonuclease RAMP protein Cas6 [Dehalococcoidia bacterium]MDW8252606.1 CRISPR system precrRNA processing endoribonuclease RAMP protein Cas6 [Chloroflexota bacterium]
MDSVPSERLAAPIWLRFLTPTSFADAIALPGGRRIDRPIVLPDPAKLVEHLGRRWNALFPDRALPADVLAKLGQLAAVARVESLRTLAVPFRSAPWLGLWGRSRSAASRLTPGRGCSLPSCSASAR